MPVPGTLKKTVIDERELVNVLQDKFGIEPLITKTYLRLVQLREISLQDIAKLLNKPIDEVEELLEKMISKGLVIRTAGTDPKYTALHPRMGMTNIFKVYEKELVQNLRDRRATLDRIVNLLTPVFEDRPKK
jgi:sugar-specific transcriptional regulator TrmB